MADVKVGEGVEEEEGGVQGVHEGIMTEVERGQAVPRLHHHPERGRVRRGGEGRGREWGGERRGERRGRRGGEGGRGRRGGEGRGREWGGKRRGERRERRGGELVRREE